MPEFQIWHFSLAVLTFMAGGGGGETHSRNVIVTFGGPLPSAVAPVKMRLPIHCSVVRIVLVLFN